MSKGYKYLDFEVDPDIVNRPHTEEECIETMELEEKFEKGLWEFPRDNYRYSYLVCGNPDAMLNPESYLSY